MIRGIPLPEPTAFSDWDEILWRSTQAADAHCTPHHLRLRPHALVSGALPRHVGAQGPGGDGEPTPAPVRPRRKRARRGCPDKHSPGCSADRGGRAGLPRARCPSRASAGARPARGTGRASASRTSSSACRSPPARTSRGTWRFGFAAIYIRQSASRDCLGRLSGSDSLIRVPYLQATTPDGQETDRLLASLGTGSVCGPASSPPLRRVW